MSEERKEMRPEDVNTEVVSYQAIDEWLQDLNDIGVQFCLWRLIPRYVKMLEYETKEPATSKDYVVAEEYKKIIRTLRMVQESLYYDVF